MNNFFLCFLVVFVALDLPCLHHCLCDICHKEQWVHFLENSNIRVCSDCGYRILAKSNFAKIQKVSLNKLEE